MQINAVTLPAKEHFKTGMQKPFAVHALANACFVHQVHRDLFEYTGANPPEHILSTLPLNNDGVDARLVQQLAEQQARRSAANNSDLSACNSGHEFSLSSLVAT